MHTVIGLTLATLAFGSPVAAAPASAASAAAAGAQRIVVAAVPVPPTPDVGAGCTGSQCWSSAAWRSWLDGVPTASFGSGSGSGSGSARGCESLATGPVDCATAFGWWSNGHQCYVSATSPPPPTSDPVWQGNTTGGIYECSGNAATGVAQFWLPGPPAAAAVDPAVLAVRALSTVQLPGPAIHRSPMETNADPAKGGQPYSWVNVWTWFWVEPAQWVPLTATARAGAVWSTVTVTPTRLRIDPGDGGGEVTCVGPGREWTEADENVDPSGVGGCGHRYLRVSESVTATASVDWNVTWQGAGSAGGTLPLMTSSASSSFVVQQIQVVNR